MNVSSAFKYQACEEQPDGQGEDGSQRVMILMCPVTKFIPMINEFPQCKRWMIHRALIRRNYFRRIEQILYERHEVDKIWRSALSKKRKLTEEELEFLYERIYKHVTKLSQKVMLDPLKLEIREELTEDDICELLVGVEVENAESQESIYA